MNDSDNDLDTDKTDKDKNQDQDNDWKDTQKVPYKRFEEVVRSNQEYREKIDELSEKLDTIINSSTSRDKGSDKSQATGYWDKVIKGASSWDEVFGLLPQTIIEGITKSPELRQRFFSTIKEEFDKKDKEAEDKVNKEIKTLYDKGILTTADEENALIDYAIKKSKEVEEYIPLRVAVAMMKSEGKWGKKNEDKDGKNKKVVPGQKGGTGQKGERTPYGQFRHKSLDTIVMEESEKMKKS